MSIAVFDISKAQDDTGKDIEPLHEYIPGAIRYACDSPQMLVDTDSTEYSHPKPFECKIVPRSEKAISLIRTISDEHPLERGDGEILKNLEFNEYF